MHSPRKPSDTAGRSRLPVTAPPPGVGRAINDELAQAGRKMQERVFATAAQHFHSAAWIAARAGVDRARLDAQLGLADALLRNRQYHAALASYRFALRLAADHAADSSLYWLLRATIAQALRRTGDREQSKCECTAVRLRLSAGPLPDTRYPRQHISRIVRNTEALLEAGAGEFAWAAQIAADIADSFVSSGDPGRAALQHANAALWSACAAESIEGGPARLSEAYDHFGAALRLLAAPQGAEEDLLQVRLLGILLDLMTLKLQGVDSPAPRSPAQVLEELDRVAAAPGHGEPSLALHEALFRLRLAERTARTADALAARRQIHELGRRHPDRVDDWLEQDLGVRFRWEARVTPLAHADPALTSLLRGIDAG